VHCPKLFPTLDPTINRFDRIPLVAPASAVGFSSFVSNDQMCGVYGAPGENCSLLSGNAANAPQPTVLRGLQAIITLRSGQLQVVDIDDPDRNCAGANRTQDDAMGTPRAFQPHLPRFAAPFNPLPALSGAPLLQLLGANITASTELPSLTPLPNCPSSLSTAPACDVSNNYCVCLPSVPGIPTAVDPLAVHDDTWKLTYEGPIPNFLVDNGGFVPVDGTTDNVLVQAPSAAFCAHGVLTGDRVTLPNDSPYVLSSDVNFDAGQVVPPVDAGALCSGMVQGQSFCQYWFGNSATPCNRELEILDARDGQLTLRTVPDPTRCGGDGDSGHQRDALLCCYPQVTQFNVRPAGAWTVVGTRAGFLHNVVADPNDPQQHCVTSNDRYPTGRAYENQVYASPAFTLQIASGTTTDANGQPVRHVTTRDTDFQFSIASGVTPLVLPVGLLPMAVHYQCEDRRLYIVDQGRSSLYEYPIAPLAAPRTFN
jgi:hypothetical protein